MEMHFDWEVKGVREDTVHLLMGQKKLEDKYRVPNMQPKVNKADMAEIMEAIEEYLILHHGDMKVPLA